MRDWCTAAARRSAKRAFCAALRSASVLLLKVNSHGSTIILTRSVKVKRTKTEKPHFFTHSRRLVAWLKILPIRFLPLAPDDLFGTIVESELCKFALILRRGRNAREIFIARCSIARGNQLLRGREYCRRSGVLLARGVRRRSSFRTVPGIESIAGVDRYHLGTDATCPSPLP